MMELITKSVGSIVNAIQQSAVLSVRAIKSHTFTTKISNLPDVQKVTGVVKVDQSGTEKQIAGVGIILEKIRSAVLSIKFPTKIEVSNFPKPEPFPQYPKDISVNNFPKQKDFPKDISVNNLGDINFDGLKGELKEVTRAVEKLKLDPKIEVSTPAPVVVPAPSVTVKQEKFDYDKLAKSVTSGQEKIDYEKLASSIGSEIAQRTVTTGGGGGSISNASSDGRPGRALIDNDRHLQVDVLTMPDIAVDIPPVTIDTTGLATEAKQLPDNHQVTVSNQPSEFPLPASQITTLTPPPAITGFATAANQLPDGHNVTVDNASIAVTGTFWQATQPVSAASLPLPTGAATEAKQDVQINQITDLTNVNIHTGVNEFRVFSSGHVCEANTTDVPLVAEAVFLGEWQDTLDYTEVIVSVVTDANSADDGLVVQWSSLGTSVDETDVYSIFANSGKTFSFPCNRRYVRISYTNGDTTQTLFNLSTYLKRFASKGSSHRLKDDLVEQDDAIVTKTLIAGKTTAGGGAIVNVKVTPSGALNVAATQDGTWNINNITGTVSLPTGASTSALQTTGNTTLSSIDTKIDALTTPTDTQPISAVSLPLPTGAATSALQQTDALTDAELRASAVLVDTTPLATQVDEASATVTYVGEAAAGSGVASAVWRIKKIDTSSGTTITWADGNTTMDNVWNNRASLTYS